MPILWRAFFLQQQAKREIDPVSCMKLTLWAHEECTLRNF